jgi:hypothetical protein
MKVGTLSFVYYGCLKHPMPKWREYLEIKEKKTIKGFGLNNNYALYLRLIDYVFI